MSDVEKPLLSVPDEAWKSVPGESAPRRHPLVADGDFYTTYTPSVRTLYDNFESAVERFRMHAAVLSQAL